MELAREKTQLDRARKLAKIEDLIKREEDVCAVLCKPATCARRVRKITCLCLLCVWCGTTVGFFGGVGVGCVGVTVAADCVGAGGQGVVLPATRQSAASSCVGHRAVQLLRVLCAGAHHRQLCAAGTG
jgi:hypothetical protein